MSASSVGFCGGKTQSSFLFVPILTIYMWSFMHGTVLCTCTCKLRTARSIFRCDFMRLCFALVGWHGGRDACLPCSTGDGLRDEAEWACFASYHPTNLPTCPFFFWGGRFLLLSMRAMCNKKEIQLRGGGSSCNDRGNGEGFESWCWERLLAD